MAAHGQDFYLPFAEKILVDNVECGVSNKEIWPMVWNAALDSGEMNDEDIRNTHSGVPVYQQHSRNLRSNNVLECCCSFDSRYYPSVSLLKKYGKNYNTIEESVIPEYDKNISDITEGKLKRVEVNRRNKSRILHDAALKINRDIHGGYNRCVICGCGDYKFLTDVGKTAMHVHHYPKISSYDDAGNMDSINNLLKKVFVVCGTCHSSMDKASVEDPEEFKRLLNT
jgi:predicted HNH restriction endonuclease